MPLWIGNPVGNNCVTLYIGNMPMDDHICEKCQYLLWITFSDTTHFCGMGYGDDWNRVYPDKATCEGKCFKPKLDDACQ